MRAGYVCAVVGGAGSACLVYGYFLRRRKIHDADSQHFGEGSDLPENHVSCSQNFVAGRLRVQKTSMGPKTRKDLESRMGNVTLRLLPFINAPGERPSTPDAPSSEEDDSPEAPRPRYYTSKYRLGPNAPSSEEDWFSEAHRPTYYIPNYRLGPNAPFTEEDGSLEAPRPRGYIPRARKPKNLLGPNTIFCKHMVADDVCPNCWPPPSRLVKPIWDESLVTPSSFSDVD